MAVGRDGQNLIRAELGRKRNDAARPATNAARMHRTLIDTTDMASPETRAQGVNLRQRAL